MMGRSRGHFGRGNETHPFVLSSSPLIQPNNPQITNFIMQKALYQVNGMQ